MIPGNLLCPSETRKEFRLADPFSGSFSLCPFLLFVTIDLLFPSASSTVTCGSHGELVSLRGITFSCSGFRLSATCSFTVIACSDPSDIFRVRARFVALSATKYCDPLRVSYSLFSTARTYSAARNSVGSLTSSEDLSASGIAQLVEDRSQPRRNLNESVHKHEASYLGIRGCVHVH